MNIERTVEEQTKHRNDHYIIFFSLKHFFNIRVPFLAAAITNHSCGFSLFCPQQRKFHKIHGGTWLSKIQHLHIFYSWMCAPNLVATRVQCIKIWYEKNQNSKHKFINADINHWRIYTLSKLNTITAEKNEVHRINGEKIGWKKRTNVCCTRWKEKIVLIQRAGRKSISISISIQNKAMYRSHTHTHKND